MRGACIVAVFVVGCGPGERGGMRSVVSLSSREIVDVAIAPDGAAWLSGFSTGLEITGAVSFGQGTFRPWLARLDPADGVTWEWIGAVGRAEAVAVAPDGEVYAVTSGNHHLEWSRPCELTALDATGTPRFVRDWPSGGCPTQLLAHEGGVVGVFAQRVEALDRDGEPRWSRPTEGRVWEPAWVEGGAIWVGVSHPDAGGHGPDRARAFDVDTGARVDFQFGIGGWGSFLAQARDEAVVVVELADPDTVEPTDLDPELHLRRYEPGGFPRWTIPFERFARDGDVRILDHVAAARPVGAQGYAIYGTRTVRRDDASPEERIWVRTAFEPGTPRDQELAFVGDLNDDDPTTECVPSDVGPDRVTGTSVTAVRESGDQLLLVGRRHCRHAWAGWIDAP